MSRLIVKGLPNSINDVKLREMFGARGAVTDCQLKYFPDTGKFRGFGFVGFESEKEAQDAREYFNGTFVGTRKIVVETCKAFGDDSKPRAWSKHSKESSAYQKTQGGEKMKTEVKDGKFEKKKSKTEAKFGEFMQLHGKEVKSEEKEEIEEDPEDLVKELLPQVVGDLKQAVLLSGLPSSVKLKNLQEFLAPVKPKVIKIARNASTATCLIMLARMPDKRRLLKRDGDFFGGFKISIKNAPSSNEAPPKTQQKPKVSEAERQAEEQKNMDAILESGRLFVRNLSYSCSETAIQEVFGKVGKVSDVKFPVDRMGRGKGFAIVTFMFPEHAVKAYSELDGTIFMGRMLHVLPGQESKTETPKPCETPDAKSSFKSQKESDLKSTSGSSHNWNALFLGAAAVADALAAKLDTDKRELLDAKGDKSLGVRMALGETGLVRETREFLLQNGVELDSFSRPDAARSDTVILVKNLPANTNSEQLTNIFGKYGELGRVVMPPEGISALVEFSIPQEAKSAFTCLAYSRFKNKPLYLEWAPGEVFSANSIAKNQQKQNKSSKKQTEEETETDESPTSSAKPEPMSDEEAEPETTVFVKNLSFDTTDDGLREKFKKCGPLVYATVSKKRDQKKSGQMLSMGYGFVQFRRRTHAQNAIKTLQGTLLNGHSLELKVSHRDLISESNPKSKSSSSSDQGECSKILIRNIPFQTSKSELTELFSAFGEIRSVRLPMKVSESSHRGFGFVDFVSKNEARRAFEALCHSTHFYGRRLVLEWAKEEEDLDVLRKRSKEQLDKAGKGGRKKKRLMQSIEESLDY